MTNRIDGRDPGTNNVPRSELVDADLADVEYKYFDNRRGKSIANAMYMARASMYLLADESHHIRRSLAPIDNSPKPRVKKNASPKIRAKRKAQKKARAINRKHK